MNKIIALAPMDGITNNAYRMICDEIRNNQKNHYTSDYDFYRFTEFMSAEGYIRQPRKLCKHLVTLQGSHHTIAQIYGGNHENLLQTAIDIDKKYNASFQGIELNIGCPSPKIMSCEAGSGMLRCRPKTLQIIKYISESISKPFSIKTRTGLTYDDLEEQFDFIMEAAPYCSMISIHGRNYKQSHSGEVNRDFIVRIKNELIKQGKKDILIIGNGGLKSVDDGLGYMNDGIDGIMLGQSAMCNPRSLVSYKPDTHELYEVSIRHLHYNLANERYFNEHSSYQDQSNTLLQPDTSSLDTIIKSIEQGQYTQEKWYSLIEFRKHLFRYVSGLNGCNEFKRQVATITEYPELLQAIHNFFIPLL